MMSPALPDRRIRRTQRLLQDALVALVLEKGYRGLTIQDVAARADIGYRTFFRHYESLDALLMDVARSVMETMDAHLNIYQQPAETWLSDETRARRAQLFAYVRENERVFRVLLLDDGVRFVLGKFLQRVRRRVALSLMRTAGDTPLVWGLANHLLISTLGLLRWWLEFDFPYDDEEMGALFAELIVYPVWQRLEQAA